MALCFNNYPRDFMKNLKAFFLFFFVFVTLNAQQLEIWKNYTNTNDVRKIALSGNDLWAVTSGGLFRYNLTGKTFSFYTKSENLSSQNLNAIAVDGNGQVWVGSGEGYINIINPADGSVKKIFDIYNSSMTQKGINDFLVSGDTLFVSHGFGLSLINTGTMEFMDNVIKFGNLQTETSVISVSRYGKIFACLNGGLAIQKQGTSSLFSPDSWDSYSSNGLQFNKTVSFNNSIYVATNSGLYTFNAGIFSQFLLGGVNIVDLAVNGSYLYILTPATLYRYSTTLETVADIGSAVNSFSSLAAGGDFVFASSDNGITQVSNAGTSKISTNSPAANTFMNMDIDANGNLWAGTGKDGYGKGAIFFNGTEWTNYYDETKPAPGNDFHNVYAGTDGTVYWMNWGQGYSTFKNNQITAYNTINTPMVGIKDNLSFLVISDIKNDSKGNTWFVDLWPADQNVLWELKTDGTWQNFTFPNITVSQLFYKLVIDKFSTKWVTVQANIEGGNKGIIAFNESSSNPMYNFYSTADGLNSDIVNCLTLDSRGYLWIGTSSGINYIPDTSNPRIYSVAYNTGIKYQNITSMAVDALDQKWVGTKTGLFVLSPDCITQIKHYDITNSPLPSDEITSVVVDKRKGIAYIGTDYGLTVLKTDFVEPKESFDEIITYPSPYIVGDGKGTLLKIDGLVQNSSIKIISLKGELVAEFKTSGGRIGFWDGRDLNGTYVPSGVYYLIAYDQEGNNVAKAKIAVIKK